MHGVPWRDPQVLGKENSTRFSSGDADTASALFMETVAGPCSVLDPQELSKDGSVSHLTA